MPIKQMDYPHRKILMKVETEIEAAWRINSCRKEPWTQAFVDRVKPGELFIDVGANVGAYTLIAATAGARVIAIEPFYANAGRMGENLALNNALRNVLLLQMALGEEDGVTEFHIGDLRAGSASHILGPVYPAKPTFHTVPVLVMPLDALQPVMGDVPRYIKIDTDGNEQSVLKGMTATLQHPATQAVMLEYRLPDEPAVLTWFKNYGYRQTERYNEREGKQIQGVAYGLFERG